MRVLSNEDLSIHTTIKIGGISKEYFIPESTEELLQIIQQKSPKYFIGGGSNLLINEREYDIVIDLGFFDNTIHMLKDGFFKVGASVRLQKLINFINENGYGGIEYLYSVPGLLGGAIVMNAGRGEQFHQTISNYIISVDVIRAGKIITLTKDQCNFSHRSSVFKGNHDIIVSVLLKFPQIDTKEANKLKEERLKLCRENQDNSHPNFGSVFIYSNRKIMNFARKYKIGKKVYFSPKTLNWLINENGSFKDAMYTIKKIEQLHKITFKKYEREVIIWK